MKIDRLLAIVMILLRRGRTSAKDLAARFDVSERTIYRDLDAIDRAGIPITSYAGVAGGYEITESFRLERQYLSVAELQSIVTALQGIQSTLDDPDLDILLEKVGALVSRAGPHHTWPNRQPVVIQLNPWQSGHWDREIFGQLRVAIRDGMCVRITYLNTRGLFSERDVEPMTLVLKGYVWYLYGFCRLRQDFRIFRLSRIKQLTGLCDRVEARPDALSALDGRWTDWGEQATTQLDLHFTQQVRVQVEDFFDPDVIELQSDGSLRVRVDYPEDEWLYSMLLGYGAEVRVFQPAHVAQRLRERAEKIVQLYL